MGRFEPMEEPRMIIKNGPRVSMDSTRMTQHGSWNGAIRFKGRRDYHLRSGRFLEELETDRGASGQ